MLTSQWTMNLPAWTPTVQNQTWHTDQEHRSHRPGDLLLVRSVQHGRLSAEVLAGSSCSGIPRALVVTRRQQAATAKNGFRLVSPPLSHVEYSLSPLLTVINQVTVMMLRLCRDTQCFCAVSCVCRSHCSFKQKNAPGPAIHACNAA